MNAESVHGPDHTLLPAEVDCLILGGGITGAGVARDAAMRGLRTLLVDSHDFASGTSHLTSKVIHGGLRYLEHGHFRLVWEGIVERDRLLNQLAPNLVTPLRFVIPFEGHRFPKWLLTLSGLQLYGALEWYHDGRRSGSCFGGRLREDYPTLREHPFAVSFWDAQANDARLVMATLRTAQTEGAKICNYTSVADARFEHGAWTADLFTEHDEAHYSIRAKSIVNATGPWAPVTTQLLGGEPMPLLWIKGSHILLERPKGFGNDAIVIRSVRDLRLLWVIPWETRLIVGTTESKYAGDLRNVRPDADEIDDLFMSFTRYFPTSGLTRGDIRCAYAGVRPIIDQGGGSENSLSRKSEVVVDRDRRLITVNGGKLTTFRRMAEQAIDEVDRLLPRPTADADLRHRLRNAPLWPGLSRTDAARWIAELANASAGGMAKRSAAMPASDNASNGSCAVGRVVSHLVRLYGRDAAAILKEATRDQFLGGQTSRPRREGPPLFDDLPYCLAELLYLCKTEQVCHLLDLVKRRTSIYFLADDGGQAVFPRIVERIAPVLGWNAERRASELSAVREEFESDCSALGDFGVPRVLVRQPCGP
jgi:glycerol-3-phosphate dehydrogenase